MNEEILTGHPQPILTINSQPKTMNGSMAFPPGALNRKQAEYYVGGREFYKELSARHPELMTPIRRTERSKLHLKADLDAALIAERLSTR